MIKKIICLIALFIIYPIWCLSASITFKTPTFNIDKEVNSYEIITINYINGAQVVSFPNEDGKLYLPGDQDIEIEIKIQPDFIDINKDYKIGLAEAIYCLQITAGIISE